VRKGGKKLRAGDGCCSGISSPSFSFSPAHFDLLEPPKSGNKENKTPTKDERISPLFSLSIAHDVEGEGTNLAALQE
jgi:hypothetical protein